MDLKSANVVVTGAARGIGKVVAAAFHAAGARVFLVDILEEAVTAAARALAAGAGGPDAVPLTADVTDRGSVDAMVGRLRGYTDSVDVLVNNAGTFSVIAPVWEADPERWFRDIRVNLYGNFLVSRAVIPLMIPNRRGYVINVVSSGGVGDPHPYCTSYASSKTGLMRLTEGMAKELAEHGIVVFAVAPPAVLSDMTRFIMEDEGGRKYRPHFADIFEKKKDHPPEVVADTILRLVEGKADGLTGRYIPAGVDLGEMLRDQARILEEDLYTLRIRRERA